MEKLIKLNEIVKKVSPEAWIDIDGGKITIVDKVPQNIDKSNPIDFVESYFMAKNGVLGSMDTTVEIKGNKFVFNLNRKGLKIHVKVNDDERIENVIRVALRPYMEFNLEDFRFIFNNMKKGKNVSADINDDILTIKIKSSEILSIDLDTLKNLYRSNKLFRVLELGSVKDNIKDNIKVKNQKYEAIIERLLNAGLKREEYDAVLPIDGDSKIIVKMTQAKDYQMMVTFKSPYNERIPLSYAVIETDEDVDKLVGIIEDICSFNDPINKLTTLLGSLFGYVVAVDEDTISVSNGKLILKYNKENYGKILEDIVFIEGEIRESNLVPFRGSFIYDVLDIISGKSYHEKLWGTIEKSRERDNIKVELDDKRESESLEIIMEQTSREED